MPKLRSSNSKQTHTTSPIRSYLFLLLLLERAVGPGERLEEEGVGRAGEVLGEEARHAAQHPRQARLAPSHPGATPAKDQRPW